MISRATVTNYKSHEQTVLDLGRLTVLVGPNASGKSSVLEAISSVSEALRRGVRDALPMNELEPRIRQSARDEAGATVSGPGWSLGFFARREGGDWKKPELEWKWNGTEGKSPDVEEVPRKAVEALGRVQLLRLDARKLAEPRYSTESPTEMTSDGVGLANVVAEMLSSRDERFGEVETALKHIVPAVKAVKTHRVKVMVPVEGRQGSQSLLGDELLFDFAGAAGVPARFASEGTLIALGLLASTHRGGGPGLVLLDDIEHGLHYAAQRELVRVLQRLLETAPELQIVATTHSAYLLDEVDAQDVWVMDVDGEGRTATRRLSDHPQAGRTLEVLMPGELYGHVGSKWVTEGRHG